MTGCPDSSAPRRNEDRSLRPGTTLAAAATAQEDAPLYPRDNLPKACTTNSSCLRKALLEQCYREAKVSIESHFELKRSELLLEEAPGRGSPLAWGLSRTDLSVERRRKLGVLDEIIIAGDLEACRSLADGYTRLAKLRNEDTTRERHSSRSSDILIQEVTTNMAQVLVAKTEIGLGHIVVPASFRWQEWPTDAINARHIQRSARPDAVTYLTGTVARVTMLPGDPVYARHLVKAGEGGALPPGLRAISTRIKEETGIGKLILPNDLVDVVLTPEGQGKARTMFESVRVLTIGQLIQAADGKKLAEGSTATLELTVKQSEELAAANAKGEVSLVLRGVATDGLGAKDRWHLSTETRPK